MCCTSNAVTFYCGRLRTEVGGSTLLQCTDIKPTCKDLVLNASLSIMMQSTVYRLKEGAGGSLAQEADCGEEERREQSGGRCAGVHPPLPPGA